MVDGIGNSLLMLARVSLVYLALYVVLPTLLTRVEFPAAGIWDRLFAGLTHATLLTILIVHVLVGLRLYETFSLLSAYAAVLVIRLRLRGRSAAAAGVVGADVMVRLLDASEERMGFVHGLLTVFRESWAHRSVHLRLLWCRLNSDWFAFCLPATLLLAAAWVRLQYPLTHAAYSFSDPYEHLAWVKYLGMNQIYVDGIYPQGYHAVISALAKLSFIDPYWLIRFFGGIGTCVLVAAVYYFTLRITGSRAAGLISLCVYGLVSDPQFPSALARQGAALPQEYSLIFGLCALHFLMLYLEHRRHSHLLIFLEAVAVTVLIHPYTTVYLAVWSVVCAVLMLARRRVEMRRLLLVGVSSVAAVLLGAAPLLGARLLGKEWFGAATQFVMGSIGQAGPPPAGPWWSRLVAGNAYLDLMLPLLVGIVLATALRRVAGKWRIVEISVITTVMLALFRARDLGLPELSEQSRTGAFLAPLLAIAYGAGLFTLCQLLFSRRGRWATGAMKGAALLTCMTVVIAATPPLPAPDPVEYDAAALNYLRIKSEFPVLDWTIVAPSEQFQQAVGIGWHYDLLRFVQDFSLQDASYPDFRLPIPTRHIFFFVERRSLLDQADTTSVDADRQLEPEGPDPYTQYYRSPDQRLLLQGKAWQWMQAYRQTHAGISVYYQDEQLIVYHIVHEPPEQ